MRYLTLIVAALLIVALSGVSEAACGRWYPGKNIRARRDAGEGVGQANGPGKRLFRGCN